jgi:hypothetical protein
MRFSAQPFVILPSTPRSPKWSLYKYFVGQFHVRITVMHIYFALYCATVLAAHAGYAHYAYRLYCDVSLGCC